MKPPVKDDEPSNYRMKGVKFKWSGLRVFGFRLWVLASGIT
jgi:hypothetical protein